MSTGGKPAALRGREQYPHVREEIGEDPARFLDREILVTPSLRRLKVDERGARYVPDTNVSDPLEFIRDRIRGIDRFEVLEAWGYVERNLVRTPDGSHNEAGREKIIELLQQRARDLAANGDRDEQLEHRREVVETGQDADEDVDPTVWRHDVDDCGSTDVERVSSRAFDCHGCGKRVSAAGDRIVEVTA